MPAHTPSCAVRHHWKPSEFCSGRKPVVPPVRGVLSGELLELVLHSDGAALGLGLLPSLLEALLEVLLVKQAVHRILDVPRDRVLAPCGGPLEWLLRVGAKLPEGVLLEGVQHG